jgi:hypothetical protein
VDLPRRGLPSAGSDDPSGQSAAFGLLGEALLGCAADHRSGTLLVSGEPGGTIHFVDGGVTAIDTPGAPGPEVVLLRSGRMPEPGWQDAFAAAAADGRMNAELVGRGLIGAGQLEVVLRATLADSMFALMSGQVDECRLEQATAVCLLPLEPPAEPGWLLSETSRRLRVLGSMPNRIHHDRDRVLRGHRAPPVGSPLDGGQEGILALANGRRTARDIAFALGWGVYALTLEFARMQEAGLLAVGPRRSVTRDRPPGPVPAGEQDAAGDSVDAGHADNAGAGAGGQVAALPRRRKSSGGQPRRSEPAAGRPSTTSGLLRLLRSGSLADQEPDGNDGS